MYEQMKQDVFEANLALVKHHLVILTWGNVSGIDRENGLVAIKPSGVDYAAMTSADIVLVDLEGRVVEGKLKPSSDLATHLELYRAWPTLGGIVHTHAPFTTSFAQAGAPIPCLGTTHADHFHGEVPCTRMLTREEVEGSYERNTGKVILERFASLDPVAVPGVIVAGHGPFTWGSSPRKAVENSVALEQIAQMAIATRTISPNAETVPAYILDKHYFRKHGTHAYYGQP